MLPEPSGGGLVERVFSDAERVRLRYDPADLPAVPLGVEKRNDPEKIAVGAYSPLERFATGAPVGRAGQPDLLKDEAQGERRTMTDPFRSPSDSEPNATVPCEEELG